jgi:hypothetical protein
VMDDRLGVPMRGGTLSQSEPAPTEGRGEPVEEARGAVAAPAVAPVDEPSGRPGGQRAW